MPTEHTVVAGSSELIRNMNISNQKWQQICNHCRQISNLGRHQFVIMVKKVINFYSYKSDTTGKDHNRMAIKRKKKIHIT